MSSTWKRTRQRALSFTHAVAHAIRSTFSTFSLLKSHHTHFPPEVQYAPIPTHDPPASISRPRQLQRTYRTSRNPHPRRVHMIHRLPLELLAHVFVLAAEDDFMLPITVSHVSRAWRALALRTPTLWRRIMLTASSAMWTERISRARACMLDIQLLSWTRVGARYTYHQFLDADAVLWRMHLVVPLLRRWRSLEVVFSEYSPFLWNAALSAVCAPRNSRRLKASVLESLTLVYRLNDDTKEFCLFSGRAPTLRRLTIDGIRLTWLPSLFGNLTFLDYTHHGFTSGYAAVLEVISMLEVSSALTTLHLLFPLKPFLAPPTRSRPVRRRVVLSALHTLHLRVEGPDVPFELAHVMTLLLTPSLMTLRLIDLGRSPHSFQSLKSFFYVYAISPSLRHLHIEHGWFDHGMIAPMLRSLPELERVVVRRPYAQDHVLDLHTMKRMRKQGVWSSSQRRRRESEQGYPSLHVHPVWTMQRVR